MTRCDGEPPPEAEHVEGSQKPAKASYSANGRRTPSSYSVDAGSDATSGGEKEVVDSQSNGNSAVVSQEAEADAVKNRSSSSSETTVNITHQQHQQRQQNPPGVGADSIPADFVSEGDGDNALATTGLSGDSNGAANDRLPSDSEDMKSVVSSQGNAGFSPWTAQNGGRRGSRGFSEFTGTGSSHPQALQTARSHSNATNGGGAPAATPSAKSRLEPRNGSGLRADSMEGAASGSTDASASTSCRAGVGEDQQQLLQQQQQLQQQLLQQQQQVAMEKFIRSEASLSSLPSRRFRFLRALPVFFLMFLVSFLAAVFIMYHCLPLIQLHVAPDQRDRGRFVRGLAELITFGILLLLFNLSYWRSVITPPGGIPDTQEWELNQNEEEISYNLPQIHETKCTGKPRHCKWCRKLKPDRAHHCRVCRACVLKMDHHCPWIYNCVGWGNHKFFLLCLFYGALTTVFVGAAMFESVRHAVLVKETPFDKMFLILFAETMNCFIGLLVTAFLIFHLSLLRHGMTTIELCEKQFKWKDGAGGSVWSRGCYGNFIAAFGANPILWFFPVDNRVGNGICFVCEDTRLLAAAGNAAAATAGLDDDASPSPSFQNGDLETNHQPYNSSSSFSVRPKRSRRTFEPILET